MPGRPLLPTLTHSRHLMSRIPHRFAPKFTSGFRFRFRYVLHPFAAKYSHWMSGSKQYLFDIVMQYSR
jgi:hypothetical protein